MKNAKKETYPAEYEAIFKFLDDKDPSVQNIALTVDASAKIEEIRQIVLDVENPYHQFGFAGRHGITPNFQVHFPTIKVEYGT